MSNYSTFAAANNPSKPSIILKDSSRSTKTSIMVTWPKVSDTEIPISGYILQMAPAGTNNYTVVYDGSIYSQTTSFLVKGLTTGNQYSFILYAVNFNSMSQPSDPVIFNACLVPS